MLSSLNMPACDGNYCLRYLLWCGRAGSSLEVKIETDCNDAVGIKTEADSNDITEYPCDDGPSIGMFRLFYIYIP